MSPLRTSEGVSFCSFITDITERKQADEKLHAQLARHSLLNRITRAIGERQDLSSIFKVVISTLERDLPVDAGWVCIYDPARQRLRVSGVGAKSLPVASALELTEGADIPLDTNGLSRCVNGQLVYEPDISGVDSPFTRRLATQGLRSLVVAPLAVESQVFGALMVARWEPAAFSSPECEFLRQLSEHVALAAHQGQIHGALQHAYDDLRHSQQAVLQHERLRALGEMASGIAHDINNAVSPVALYSEMMLQTEGGLSVDGREYLETINRAMEDVAATVARLREFYRPREPQVALAAADLNQVVRQVLHLTRARWLDMPQQHGITIKTVAECAPDLPVILGIEGELREALTNLIFNGVDAMPQGGTLTIRTSVTGRKPDSPAQVDEREVHVEVVDTGVGMDEPTRQRCLEPFFTTKGERGTGLGLAMVYGAVAASRRRHQHRERAGQGDQRPPHLRGPHAGRRRDPSHGRAEAPGTARHPGRGRRPAHSQGVARCAGDRRAPGGHRRGRPGGHGDVPEGGRGPTRRSPWSSPISACRTWTDARWPGR